MVTQAEKYKRIGISSILENVDEDDVDKLAINYKSINVTLSSAPVIISNTIDVEVENTSSDVITETVILRVDNRRVRERTVTFNGTETKTVTFEYVFFYYGKDYTVSSGRNNNTVSTTVELNL